jgi:hypothetical protein
MRPPGGGDSVIVAEKSATRTSAKSDPDDLEVMKTGAPFVEVSKRADQNGLISDVQHRAFFPHHYRRTLS